ncbi:hypothetical protein [Azonexus sp. R2A61]|uniref:hypothetical protein n=1 Tax=Azonexus sp. R2A61 TaxID=2744443 RepID=UPI001F39A285|nr:hypothetical protein [Azonexus sp. R2A61]
MIPNRHRQQGAALLLVSAALFSGGLGLVLHEPAKIRNDNRQMHILKAAKAALIARAATDDNRPGSLPCPDLATDSSGLANRPGDGKADMLTRNQCPSVIGWLPWVTLNMPPPRDTAGEMLWYVIAPGLRDDDSAAPINGETRSGLHLEGFGDVAALLVAPGSPLSGQQRPSLNPGDYVEHRLIDNGGLSFLQGAGNDLVLPIRLDEVMAAAGQRTANEVLRCLDSHQVIAGQVPWPAAPGNPARQGQHERRFGHLPQTQPRDNIRQEMQQIAGKLLATDLQLRTDAPSMRTALEQQAEIAAYGRNFADGLQRAAREMSRIGGDLDNAGQRLVDTVAKAVANDRIARSEGSAISQDSAVLQERLEALDDAIDRLGFDALVWQAVRQGRHETPGSTRNRTRTLASSLNAASQRFAAQDLAEPRPLQQAIVPYANAIGAVAVDTLELAKIVVSQASTAASEAALNSQLANTLSTLILGKNQALDKLAAWQSKPTPTSSSELSAALQAVREQSAQFSAGLLALSETAIAQPAAAWPLAWASARCDFLDPALSGWWQSNAWHAQVFYQIAGGGPPIEAGGRDRLERLVIVAGPPKNGQQRPSTAVADYLEEINADASRNGDAQRPLPRFTLAGSGTGINDRLAY